MKEVLNARGRFYMEVLDAKTGKVLSVLDEPNKVVTLGHTNVARMLGGDPAGKLINKIGFGTNSAAPALTDTALTGSYSRPIDSVIYPAANSVQFNWSLNADEANGITIRELGLLNDAGNLFARKVRSDIVKTASVRIVGSWTITIN